MAIIATNTGSGQRELIPAGNYVARCIAMYHIGTVTENFSGEEKVMNKVRIGWELPFEVITTGDRAGQAYTISKEFTLSMHEKSTMRAVLQSWRGRAFSEEEAKAFDITKLLGVPCMLNIIHKPSKDGTRMYENIAGITPMPKGMTCPDQISKTEVFDYDNPDYKLVESLPDFIKDKIKSSAEWADLHAPKPAEETTPQQASLAAQAPLPEGHSGDDLPF